MFGKKKATGKNDEFAEYKEELASPKPEVKKNCIKKIIGALTVGKDMSPLFVDVVNCIQTDDMEMKKLVYLYVMSYADKKPDLAILAVSTFTKDSGSDNPILRALAIRTMGCIRVEQIAEYLCEPLHKAMDDEDPYVRKTAAVAVAKLYDITPEVVEEQGFIDSLKEMIADANPTVVSNSVAALCEIQENSPEDVFTIDVKTLQKLLAALDECIEWGQINILDALVSYSARNAREAETIVDRIAPRLQANNSAIVLSASKVILKMMDSIENEDSIKSISRKLAPPLVSLLSSDKNEIQYIALRNINLIVQKRPQILQNEIKVFFCKYNDPIFVKKEKLDILVKLAKHRNIDQLLNEFKTYATEVDVDVVRCSVRCIGACAIKIEKVADRCVKALLTLVESKVHVVVQESIIVIRDIFRRYPNKYESIIANLCENLDTLDEPEAKAAMIWIIGEYSDRIDNADELLEMFMDNFDDENSNVQLQILTGVVKLFLMKPEDTQTMVTQLLDMVTKEADNPDLRDRGFVYWRLLSKDPEIARSVVFSERPVIGEDIGAYDTELLETLLLNVGTLSAVYHKPPETFIKRLDVHEKRLNGGEEEEEEEEEEEQEEEEEEEEEEQEEEEEEPEEEEEEEEEDDEKAELEMEDLGSANGVTVTGTFSRSDGQTYFNVAFANKSGQALSQCAVQFNKNTFGLKPDEATFKLSVPGKGKGSYDLPVSAVPAQVKPGAPSNEIQIALKTSAGAITVTAHIPITAVFGENGQMAGPALGKLWGTSPDASGSKKMMTSSDPSKEGLSSALKAHNIFFSCDRGAACFYFSAKTITNQPFAIEIRTQGKNIQCIIKSAAISLSNVLNDEIANIIA